MHCRALSGATFGLQALGIEDKVDMGSCPVLVAKLDLHALMVSVGAHAVVRLGFPLPVSATAFALFTKFRGPNKRRLEESFSLPA